MDCLFVRISILLACGHSFADESSGIIAEGFLKSGRPVGLISVELAEVFQNTRIAARKLFDQFSPTLGELLRPLARRVNAFIDSRVHVLEQDRPFTLPALKHFVPDLRGTIVLQGCGHWTQQERPAEVNAAMLRFLAEVK